MNKITQVYVDGENGINRWLKNNTDKEIVDIKIAVSREGEVIMVIYKTDIEQDQ